MTPALWTLFGFVLGIVWSVAVAYLLLTSDKWEWPRQHELADRRAEGSRDQ